MAGFCSSSYQACDLWGWIFQWINLSKGEFLLEASQPASLISINLFSLTAGLTFTDFLF